MPRSPGPRVLLVAASAALLSLTAVNSARAYCRATTVDPEDPCGCSTVGNPLYWRDPVVFSYAFNERGFPHLADQVLRATIARAMANWTDVDCEGEPIQLDSEALRETTTLTKGPKSTEPNLNVITYLSYSEWRAAGLDENAFALTSNWYLSSGEIIGADVRFNGGRGTFSVCPSSGCRVGDIDLENIATHEIGHVFGLGHSDVDDSTMECKAEAKEVSKRDLERDDIDGICSIYGANAVEERTSALHKKGRHGGCSAAGPESANAGWLSASLTALLLLSTRIRRRRRAALAPD